MYLRIRIYIYKIIYIYIDIDIFIIMSWRHFSHVMVSISVPPLTCLVRWCLPTASTCAAKQLGSSLCPRPRRICQPPCDLATRCWEIPLISTVLAVPIATIVFGLLRHLMNLGWYIAYIYIYILYLYMYTNN